MAAVINQKAQEASGVPIAARAEGAVIYVGGANDSITMTTSVAISGTGTINTFTTGTSVLQQAARTITINQDDAIEGNKFTLRIGSKEYSVVAGHGTAIGTSMDIANSVATDLREKVLADYAGLGNVSGAIAGVGRSFATVAGNSLGIADMSLTVTRLTDGASVTNQMSSVSAASPNVAATDRIIRVNDFDIVAGRKVTVQIGTPEFTSSYSTVIDSNDTAAIVAQRLQSQIVNNFANTTQTGSEITLAAARNLEWPISRSRITRW